MIYLKRGGNLFRFSFERSARAMSFHLRIPFQIKKARPANSLVSLFEPRGHLLPSELVSLR